MSTATPIKLIFGVKTQEWRKDDPDADSADDDFRGVRQRRFFLDHWSCQACGCPSHSAAGAPSAGLQVHHVDNDHKNNAIENLITLCPLCHGIFHIGFQVRNKPGRFIWLPEISQGELNLLTHVCAIASIHAKDGDEDAKTLLLALDELQCKLASQKLPAGLFLDPLSGKDYTQNFAANTELFGMLLGTLVRQNANFENFQRHISGLRYLYKVDADLPDAKIYAQCQDWRPSEQWAQGWINTVGKLQSRLAAADNGKGEGA